MFFLPRRIAFLFATVVIAISPDLRAEKTNAASGAPHVEGIRFWSFGDVTRVAIETSGDYKLYSEQIENPNRIFFDLTGLDAPSAAQRKMQVIPVGDHRIRQIRVARLTGTKTRIVFDLDSPAEVVSSQLVNPDRLMIEVRPKGTSLPELSASRSFTGAHKIDLTAQARPVDADIIEATLPPPRSKATHRASQNTSSKDTSSNGDDPNDAYHPPHHVNTVKPPQFVAASVTPVSTPPAPGVITPAKIEMPSAASKPTSVGTVADIPTDRSLVRVFGLKMARVVIDAGHGGHDCGTIGPNGLREKDLVLDVALRLGALITKQMGAEVIYTRSTDVFIPLEERTRIANDQKADLFISVHANSSPEPTASGVETYYFNLTSDRGGLDLATRENATAGSSISDLSDLLHRAVLQTKREESREFALKVQSSLQSAEQKNNRTVHDRGVRQAPFLVLIGATMPSILAEIGFVSNPRDEKQLRRPDERQKIAEALYKGVAQYANSLSHVQLARASE